MESPYAEPTARLLRMLVLAVLGALAAFTVCAHLGQTANSADLITTALTSLLAGFVALFLEALLPSRVARSIDFLTGPMRTTVAALRRPAYDDTELRTRITGAESKLRACHGRLDALEVSRGSMDHYLEQLTETVRDIGELVMLQKAARPNGKHAVIDAHRATDDDSAATWTEGEKRQAVRKRRAGVKA